MIGIAVEDGWLDLGLTVGVDSHNLMMGKSCWWCEVALCKYLHDCFRVTMTIVFCFVLVLLSLVSLTLMSTTMMISKSLAKTIREIGNGAYLNEAICIATLTQAEIDQSMKRPPRCSVFSLLLVVAVVVLTLTSRVYFHCCSFEEDIDGGLVEGQVFPWLGRVPIFDSALLRLASNYSWDTKLESEIKELLRGTIGFRTWFRTFKMWRRFTDLPGVELRDPTSSGCTVLSPSINNPKFNRFCFDVRRNLDDWMGKRRFDDGVMLDLVKLVKRPIDAYVGSERKYKSCAVVGNSGILLERDYGELIDGHEAVIRLNNARIRGLEQRVGSKTSISFINSNIMHLCTIQSERCDCHPYGINVPIVMYICQPIHLLDYTACNSTYQSPVLITDPRFDVLCARIVKYYSLKRFAREDPGRNLVEWDGVHHEAEFHYSSGMQAVMLAVGICDRVGMFGFGKSNSSRHHYHTNQTAELSLHDFAAEYDLFRDLSERPRSIPFVSENFEFPQVTIYR